MHTCVVITTQSDKLQNKNKHLTMLELLQVGHVHYDVIISLLGHLSMFDVIFVVIMLNINVLLACLRGRTKVLIKKSVIMPKHPIHCTLLPNVTHAHALAHAHAHAHAHADMQNSVTGPMLVSADMTVTQNDM